jgi:hypothetical protein
MALSLERRELEFETCVETWTVSIVYMYERQMDCRFFSMHVFLQDSQVDDGSCIAKDWLEDWAIDIST